MNSRERLIQKMRQMDAALRHAKVDDVTCRIVLEHFARPARRSGRRKPPDAGIAVPAIPPRGPLPLQGGAEAPLDFTP